MTGESRRFAGIAENLREVSFDTESDLSHHGENSEEKRCDATRVAAGWRLSVHPSYDHRNLSC